MYHNMQVDNLHVDAIRRKFCWIILHHKVMPGLRVGNDQAKNKLCFTCAKPWDECPFPTTSHYQF